MEDTKHLWDFFPLVSLGNTEFFYVIVKVTSNICKKKNVHHTEQVKNTIQ